MSRQFTLVLMNNTDRCKDCGNQDCPRVAADATWSRCPAADRVPDPVAVWAASAEPLDTFELVGLDPYSAQWVADAILGLRGMFAKIRGSKLVAENRYW